MSRDHADDCDASNFSLFACSFNLADMNGRNHLLRLFRVKLSLRVRSGRLSACRVRKWRRFSRAAHFDLFYFRYLLIITPAVLYLASFLRSDNGLPSYFAVTKHHAGAPPALVQQRLLLVSNRSGFIAPSQQQGGDNQQHLNSQPSTPLI